MSVQTNGGIIMAANHNASAGQGQLPTAGALDSDDLTTPLIVNVGIAQRVVLTVAMGFVNTTSYVVRVFLNNNNLFGALAGGSARPSPLGSVNANLNVNIPVLSVAQNDTQPGFQTLDHTYTSGTTTDYIFLAGALTGLLMVRVTTAGPAPANGDYFLCSVDLF